MEDIIADRADLYKSLQIPAKVDQQNFIEMQRKIFFLENELNRYKHAAFRANNKVKFLEKKIHSFKSQMGRERQSIIACLRKILGVQPLLK